MPKTEKELIAELKNDSQKALSQLYSRYAARLYAFGMRYCKRAEVVEELVEDTFVWLWKNRHGIRQEHHIKALMFIRMRHYLINNYRLIVNEPQYESYIKYVEQLGKNDQDRLEYDDFLKQVNRAMDQLPRTQQQVVRLSKLEQMSNQEISLVLQLKEQTVRNQLSLGLKNLKKILASLYSVMAFLFYVN